MQQYLVVCRAESGIRIGKQDPITLTNFPSPFGRVDVLIQTRLAPYADFSKPVPRGLMAEIRGEAPSLDDALQEFSRIVQSLCPVLVFIGNSPIQDMTPELGFDVTPGLEERDFFQQFLPDERLLILERRRVSSELFVNVLRGLAGHPEAERLRRALAQYYQALRNWEPGQEVLALAHLWMGVEALTPVVLRRALADRGIDRATLATEWAVEVRNLDAEVRKRLILAEDEEAYARAKTASDGFEHGFLGFADIHAHSEAVRATIANHLRNAILSELPLSAEDKARIAGEGYKKPGHLRVAKYLRGKLIGSSTELAAPGQLYPIMDWKTRYIEVPNPSEDEVTIKMEESMTARIGEGIKFSPRSIEAWGGQESTLRRDGV